MKYNTYEQLHELITKLVSWQSRSGTEGEILFPHKLKDELMTISYFKEHPNNIKFIDSTKQRNALTALYQHEDAEHTICLISHFDTVHTQEFGDEEIPFNTKRATEYLKSIKNQFNEHIQEDIDSDEYIFGRGVMDMKIKAMS